MDDFNKILSKIFWISGIILLILIFTKFIKELRLSYVIEIGNW
ncbi:protein of unknown function [Methanocaldococcus lauensis]|nr:protein of unknown function [Methanocaldococcus lauensis]